MSPIGKTAPQKTSSPLAMLKPYMLPAYILLSAVFILYTAYGYMKVAVYQTGAQNGYNSAYVEIANAALDPKSCQWMTLPAANNQSVTLINVECLQAAPQNSEEGTGNTEQ